MPVLIGTRLAAEMEINQVNCRVAEIEKCLVVIIDVVVVQSDFFAVAGCFGTVQRQLLELFG